MTVGRCGALAPTIFGGTPAFCRLPHGHLGWHKADDGSEWSVPEIPGQLDLLAHARNTDPETSHAAAASVNVRESQQRVLALLREVGRATDSDLVEAARRCPWRMSDSGIRSRRAELVDAGLVRDTGLRVLLDSGRRSTVWEAA